MKIVNLQNLFEELESMPCVKDVNGLDEADAKFLIDRFSYRQPLIQADEHTVKLIYLVEEDSCNCWYYDKRLGIAVCLKAYSRKPLTSQNFYAADFFFGGFKRAESIEYSSKGYYWESSEPEFHGPAPASLSNWRGDSDLSAFFNRIEGNCYFEGYRSDVEEITYTWWKSKGARSWLSFDEGFDFSHTLNWKAGFRRSGSFFWKFQMNGLLDGENVHFGGFNSPSGMVLAGTGVNQESSRYIEIERCLQREFHDAARKYVDGTFPLVIEESIGDSSMEAVASVSGPQLAGEDPLSARLRKLKDLHDQQLISEADYTERKLEILVEL